MEACRVPTRPDVPLNDPKAGHVFKRCRCCAFPAAGANGWDMATIADVQSEGRFHRPS